MKLVYDEPSRADLTVELSGARRRSSLALHLPRVRSNEVLGDNSIRCSSKKFEIVGLNEVH